MTVDEYIKAKVQPEHMGMLGQLRTLMRAAAPQANEIISYGVIMWRGTHGLWVINPTKNGLTLSFSKGASFDDPYHLLTGAGKVAKTVWVQQPDDINEEAFKYYMAQALKQDES
ncbi:MAG TPA: DUF1801 domain-containing protein [Ktedonobacteraceae bacterium]|nr:DUF1801 domain-containing protein [Ktedonobacteraceae bacterium]